ncbi:hypothetical protein ACFL2F_03135 [Myxococcota bacterium]
MAQNSSGAQSTSVVQDFCDELQAGMAITPMNPTSPRAEINSIHFLTMNTPPGFAPV